MNENKVFNLLVETNFGQMLVNPNDHYIGQALLQYGEYSWDEIMLLEQLITKGATIVEAGSNIGAHTVPLAQRIGETGRVYAFEPQRLVFQQLCANIALNQLTNVQTYWSALGTEEAEVSLPELSPYEAHNFGNVSCSDTESKNTPDFISVAQTSIDNLQLTQCDLIKIDVEGMELSVLQGAENTIKNTRPVLYIEADKQDNIPSLVNTVTAFDYEMWWHTPLMIRREKLKHNEIEAEPKHISKTISCNVICLPKEQDIPVTNLSPVKDQNDWPFK